jgi:8-oxo-dGTP pyrophosphatase MutT (NUDIX family)
VLDLQLDRPAAPPKDAATIILVRNAPDAEGIEVFCVERSKQSRFLGGAIVFPGGKLDASDASPEWSDLTTAVRPIRPSSVPFTRDAEHLRALAISAARETLEEAAILHATSAVGDADLLALRARLVSEPGALRAFLTERGLRLDLQALHPLARWITPEAEARRYDARFFVAVAPNGQTGAHDEHETMASFWASPAEILRRWAAGEVQLAPPTHATLAQLAACASSESVLEAASKTSLDPICPRLVPQKAEDGTDTMALVLPGDPEHEISEVRLPGPSRYVLRGDRWLPENAPR